MIAPGVVSPGVLFLSTPSARRATLQTAAGRQVNAISIHALREEGDLVFEEPACDSVVLFLSTPSARRATLSTAWMEQGETISIHALREEGDSKNRDKISIFL